MKNSYLNKFIDCKNIIIINIYDFKCSLFTILCYYYIVTIYFQNFNVIKYCSHAIVMNFKFKYKMYENIEKNINTFKYVHQQLFKNIFAENHLDLLL